MGILTAKTFFAALAVVDCLRFAQAGLNRMCCGNASRLFAALIALCSCLPVRTRLANKCARLMCSKMARSPSAYWPKSFCAVNSFLDGQENLNLQNKSGIQDLNLRPLEPQSSALANLRQSPKYHQVFICNNDKEVKIVHISFS